MVGDNTDQEKKDGTGYIEVGRILMAIELVREMHQDSEAIYKGLSFVLEYLNTKIEEEIEK